MDNNEEILNHLAKSILLLKYTKRGTGSQPDQLDPEFQNKLSEVTKLVQIISKSRVTNTIDNPESLKDSLVKKVSKIHKNPLKGALFSNLTDKLKPENGIQNPGPYLYLLSRLSQHQFKFNSIATPQIEEENWFHSSGLPPINNQHHTIPASNTRSVDSTPQSFENSSLLNSGSNSNQSEQYLDLINAEFIPEKILIKDMIYIFQGVDAVYIKFDINNDLCYIDPNIKIHSGHRMMINQLFELGTLYKKVHNFVNAQLTDPASGLIVQSFCSSLQSCITEYFRLLAILDTKASDSNTNNLTFRNLYLWTKEPLRRFQLMYHMTEICYHLHGGSVISALYSLTNHGDPFVQNFCLEILNKTSKPFHDMIQFWVDEGELNDPFDEFFVKNLTTGTDDNPWNKKYFLSLQMAPSYCDSELLRKIFSIGKSLNFIRSTCRCPDWHWKNLQGGLSLQFNNLIQLTESVDLVYRLTSQELLTILLTNHRLLDHLHAMKKYLLLGQGDFVRHLMDLIHIELDKPCHTIHTHHLSSILDSAIRGSNAQFDKSDIVNRLQVEMTINPGDKSGWDCFSVTYHTSSPINTVITTSSLNIYHDLFKTLWRVKRMEVTLSQSWLTHVSSLHWLKSVPEIQTELSQCGTLMSEMIHFINQYQYFIQCEVLEPSWTEFINLVQNEAEDLDQVIEAHKETLQKIQSQIGLYDYDPVKVMLILSKIFESIITFKRIHEKFIQISLTMAKKDSKKSYHRVLSDFQVDPIGFDDVENQRIIERIRNQFDSVSTDFRDNVKFFLKHLYQKDEQGVMPLRFRLDYNEFYTGIFATSEPATSSRRSSRASHRHSWLIQ